MQGDDLATESLCLAWLPEFSRAWLIRFHPRALAYYFDIMGQNVSVSPGKLQKVECWTSHTMMALELAL